MFLLPAICSRFIKYIRYWLREISYHDMSRQASDWIPEELRVDTQPHNPKPISLDFGIPRKHRLDWLHRSMKQLPH